MDTPDKRMRQAVYDIVDEVERSIMLANLERAKRNPYEFRNSRTFNGGPRYRYYACKEKVKGWTLRFCYSVNKNIGNHYLSWTEAQKGDTVKRVGFLPHEKKADAIERSQWKLAQMKKPAAERTFKPSL